MQRAAQNAEHSEHQHGGGGIVGHRIQHHRDLLSKKGIGCKEPDIRHDGIQPGGGRIVPGEELCHHLGQGKGQVAAPQQNGRNSGNAQQHQRNGKIADLFVPVKLLVKEDYQHK